MIYKDFVTYLGECRTHEFTDLWIVKKNDYQIQVTGYYPDKSYGKDCFLSSGSILICTSFRRRD